MHSKYFKFALLFTISHLFGGPSVKIETHDLNHSIFIQRENLDKITQPMRLDSLANEPCFLSDKALTKSQPLPETSSVAGQVIFSFEIEKEDNYTVLAKVFWKDGGSNSFWIALDTMPYARLGNDGKEGEWIYVKGPSWKLKAGKHKLTVREREKGAAISSIILSPVPEYMSNELVFKNTVMVMDSSSFKEGRYYSQDQRLLVAPPYALYPESSGLIISLFFIDTCKEGILFSKAKLPLSIKSPTGHILYSGKIIASSEIRVNLTTPISGKYILQVANISKEWNLFDKRFTELEQLISHLKQKKNKTYDELFWLPTLSLHRENILRGYKQKRLNENYFPEQDYVLSQFLRAETIMAAIGKKKFEALIKPGVTEFAYYSSFDNTLCPFVVHLPDSYSSSKKTPFILYLHGSNGTQWEIQRNSESSKRNIKDLKIPIVLPFGRGNSGYVGPAENDVIDLIRIVTQKFNFDSSKIVLSGFSMGGIGTWYLGCKYPSLFSVLVPIAGALPWEWNYDRYQWRPAGSMLPEDWGGKIMIMHGTNDESVKIDNALSAQTSLLKANIPFQMLISKDPHIIPITLFDLYNNIFEILQN